MAKVIVGNASAITVPREDRDCIREFYCDVLGRKVMKADLQGFNTWHRQLDTERSIFNVSAGDPEWIVGNADIGPKRAWSPRRAWSPPKLTSGQRQPVPDSGLPVNLPPSSGVLLFQSRSGQLLFCHRGLQCGNSLLGES